MLAYWLEFWLETVKEILICIVLVMGNYGDGWKCGYIVGN